MSHHTASNFTITMYSLVLLGKINCSDANNTIDGLDWVILDFPMLAVFLREDLEITAKRDKVVLISIPNSSRITESTGAQYTSNSVN